MLYSGVSSEIGELWYDYHIVHCKQRTDVSVESITYILIFLFTLSYVTEILNTPSVWLSLIIELPPGSFWVILGDKIEIKGR